MTNSIYRFGIDIGSTTAKVVILDDRDEIVFSAYRRHNAETLETLQALLQDARYQLGDVRLSVLITGSAGLGVSEIFAIPFIQEVVASAEVVRRCYPEVRTLIDIGGEDAKMIYFNPDGVPDIRMNGSCAGGTGAFIDQMATLLNVPVEGIDALAQQAETLYAMASRCGVFAKTDVQNLLSREVPHTDIVASVLNAVVLQTLATLARGSDPQAKVLFSGGPLTFIPSLRRAFMRVLGLERDQVLMVEHGELLPAMGAALADGVERLTLRIDDLQAMLASDDRSRLVVENRLAPLFADEGAYANWEKNRYRQRTERITAEALGDAACFLGIDSGSTTTKIVLIDQAGRLVFSHYGSNNGNAIQAVCTGLEKLERSFAEVGLVPNIARSVVTGYGEDLIRAAFGCDEGMVETLAHYRAASAFDPEVSFILDIGGQDMKAIFVEDGHIRNIEINEACSSGCGTFIETFARSMGYSVVEFAERACLAKAPCDLGTRCTVFMNSRVKQALKEGASVGEISAGLAYSVIKNAIHKVLKITSTDVLGEHIIVQGGTFRNPAVHKAIENLLEKSVLSPDIAELMGAYGAALTARDTYRGNGHAAAGFEGFEMLAAASEDGSGRLYSKKHVHCQGCQNNCMITRLTFPNGNVFYTGNRCEKVFSNSGQKKKRGLDMLAKKYELLFERPTEPEGEASLTIGIPRVLNFYENYPFWCTLFVESGLRVQLSAPSSVEVFEKGVGSIMSENICFPAKLAHGHIFDLMEKRVDRIFHPMVTFEKDEYGDALNSFNCPIVTGYADVERSAIDPESRVGIPLDGPPITFQDEKLLRKACKEYLRGLGVDNRKFGKAFEKALAAQAAYKAAVQKMGADALQEARAAGKPLILLLGRPYHADPQVNHKVSEILVDFGLDVITEDAVPYEPEAELGKTQVLTQWEYPNRFYYAAHWAGKQENLEVVQLNSFGCGPDALAVDEVKGILGEYGKRHTVIRIDEIESTGSIKLRLRSLVDSLGQDESKQALSPRKEVQPFRKIDKRKVILAPQFSHFCTMPLTRPLKDMGYKFEYLPPPDRQSVEHGLKYTNNEICYPATIVIGDLIKALQSGKYNPEEVVVAITQTGGQCRASSYLALLKKAMISAGYEDIPVVALSASGALLSQQPEFEMDLKTYVYKALMSVIFADTLSTMYHATAAREENRGDALRVADKYLELLDSQELSLTPGAVLKAIERAVDEFNAIKTRVVSLPRVGIVGEIYVKFNSFANNYVARWLMDQGIEVVVPTLFEFFASWAVNVDVAVRKYLKPPDVVWLALLGVEKVVKGFQGRVDDVLSHFKYYRPEHSIRHIADKASKVVSLTHQYGEGWLIPGEIGSFAEEGINNVLCVQPFGCIANHVVGKGVEKRLKSLYPQLNLLFLDADASGSEVNFFNRMYFFINHVKKFDGEQEGKKKAQPA